MNGQFEQKNQKDDKFDIEHLIECFSPMIRKNSAIRPIKKEKI